MNKLERWSLHTIDMDILCVIQLELNHEVSMNHKDTKTRRRKDSCNYHTLGLYLNYNDPLMVQDGKCHMKSITIHNIDGELETLIRERSEKEGKSLNKTIQNLLRKALGLKKSMNEDFKQEYREFYGIWTEEDEKEFNDKIADLNSVQPGDWE